MTVEIPGNRPRGLAVLYQHVRPVENFHEGTARGYALNDLDAVEHRSRRAVPFRQYQYVAGAAIAFSSSGRSDVLRPDAFSCSLAAFRNQRTELPI